jgi:hypothetical protein
MKYGTFKCLANELRKYIEVATGQIGRLRYAPNGPIYQQVSALHAPFDGGSVYDITTAYGVGHMDTPMNSIWYVVDAINRHLRV